MTWRTTYLFLCLGVGFMGLFGCSHGAQLIQESDGGGVVTYLYKDDRGGPTGSRYRKDAVEIMRLKCPHGYTVVKEGETRGLSGASSIEGAEDEPSRRWAFQFRCKNV
jgi:hypothetical protein